MEQSRYKRSVETLRKSLFFRFLGSIVETGLAMEPQGPTGPAEGFLTRG